MSEKRKVEIFKVKRRNPVTKYPAPKNQRQLAERIEVAAKLEARIEQLKGCYREYDEIIMSLKGIHAESLIQHGRVLIDNFQDGNVAFKQVVFYRRFELKKVKS